MIQHPVTTEYGLGIDQINQTLEAVSSIAMQALVFWPNVDARLRARHQRDQALP